MEVMANSLGLTLFEVFERMKSAQESSASA
jgi:hypothetical protein